MRRDPRLDDSLGNSTRAAGLDSLQLLRGNSMPYGEATQRASELLLVASGCMDRPKPLNGVCVPVQLRTGWQSAGDGAIASYDQGCRCRDVVNGVQSFTLNCLSTEAS